MPQSDARAIILWAQSKSKIVLKNGTGDLNDVAGFIVCYFFMNTDATATNARSRARAKYGAMKIRMFVWTVGKNGNELNVRMDNIVRVR